MVRLCRVLSSLMMILGISLLLAVGGLYAYGTYERFRFEQTMAEAALGVTPAEGRDAASSSDDEAPLEEASSASDAVQDLALSTLEKPRRMPAAKWIRISKIGVDSPVVEAPLEKGEWKVPKFVVGHLEGTANPGEVGNAVFSGHLESIGSGNVFAWLKELSIGDDVTLLSGSETTRYAVTDVKVVKNDDLSVVAPMPEPVLTLITCAGTWNPLTRDYGERLVVVAKPTNEGRNR